MWKTSVVVLALCLGCKDKPRQEPVVVTTPVPSAGSSSGSSAAGSAVAAPSETCPQDAAELKAYLAGVFDPANPSVPQPWPTNNDARDAAIEALRGELRTSMKAHDPADKAKLLSPELPQGRLEKALVNCQPALDQLVAASNAKPDQRVRAMVEIADAIAKCDCKVDVPLVRALLYLGQRGPD